jgi:hypothetical protein
MVAAMYKSLRGNRFGFTIGWSQRIRANGATRVSCTALPCPAQGILHTWSTIVVLPAPANISVKTAEISAIRVI